MRWLQTLVLTTCSLQALQVRVDYTYDSRGFFDNPDARAAVEAAAARWSRVISTSLLPVNAQDDNDDARFSLLHPGTGERIQVSTAAGPGTDALVTDVEQGEADIYIGGLQVPEDEWILYVGARPLEDTGRGGPMAGGLNFGEVFEDPNSLLNRGFNSGVDSLSVLGGTVTFDENENWHFDLTSLPQPGEIDFYTIALHEIGHGFGIAARGVDEWTDLVVNNRFMGPQTIATYQQETGNSLPGLLVAGGGDFHWRDDTYDSRIFPFGDPILLGTVGRGNFQDLIMEPGLSITQGIPRFELTNVDLASLRDIGWSTITSDAAAGEKITIELTRSSDGGLVLSFPSEPGATYRLQTSESIGNWVNVSPLLQSEGETTDWADGEAGFDDPVGSAQFLRQKFFRVIKQ